ncbi:MAG: HAMP domain-containing protein, partial [Pseudomonas sp.]
MIGNIMNLRIGSKLILVFAVLILGFGALLYSTLERFVALQAAEEQQFKRSYARVSDVKELRINIIAIRAELQQVLGKEAGGVPEDYEAVIRRRAEQNEQLLQRIREGVAGDSEAQAILDPLEEARTAFAHTRDTQLLPLIRSDRLEEAGSLYRGVQSERGNKMQELGLRLTELTERRVGQALDKSRQDLEAQRQLLLQLALALVAGCAVLAWLLSRHIAQPLARLTGWAEQIGRGEIPRDIPSSARQDEVGRLGQAFVNMSQYLRDLVQELNESITVLA